MAQMKKYHQMKLFLIGGTTLALLFLALISYSLLDKSNTQQIKDRTMSIATGLVNTIKNKELDLDQAAEATWRGATENGYNYANIWGDYWKDSFSALTNDTLLVLAKNHELSDITVYNISPSGLEGVLSTQPNKIGDTLNQTDEEKEINAFLLKVQQGDSNNLSNNLPTYKKSIATSLFEYNKVLHTTVYTYVPTLDKVVALGLPLTDLTYFKETNNTTKLIDELKTNTPFLIEIGVLDTTNYQPESKEVHVLAGTFKYSSTSDNNFLANLGKENASTSSTYVQQVGENQLFKHLVVLDDSRVVYIGLDYSALQTQKSNSQVTVPTLIVLALVLIGVLHFLHQKKERAYHERIKKRLTSLARGKVNLKPIETKKDEYKELLDFLNILTEELGKRKKTSKETLQRIQEVINVISEGKVRNSQDLDEVRVELKGILQELQETLKIED